MTAAVDTSATIRRNLRANMTRRLSALERLEHYLPERLSRDECWIWRGPMLSSGYGSLAEGNVKHLAHRFVYEHFKGPIPDGFQIDHTCFVRACVNPRHLEAVTQQENLRRSAHRRERKTECPRGHALDGKNLYVNPKGHRECRRCRADRRRSFYERTGR